jgi:hypothetical protein
LSSEFVCRSADLGCKFVRRLGVTLDVAGSAVGFFLWAAALSADRVGWLAHRHVRVAPHVLGGAAGGDWLGGAERTSSAFRAETVVLQAVSLHAFTVGVQVASAEFAASAALLKD